MSAANSSPGRVLREKLAEKRGLLVPGAANALAARVIAGLGFEAVYVTGAGLTNTFFGIPDLGFMGLTDLAQHTSAMRDAVELPLIVDADTGFGNAVNVYRTVRVLERAGANAIQLEDQVSPKRCGHFAGKDVIPAAEMAGKIKAAVDARSGPDFLVIGRTDARAVEGFDAAIERAERFIAAGADVTFVEAPESIDEIRRIPERLAAPQIINIVIGGKTPVLAQQELAAMRFGMIVYANAALQAALAGMHTTLAALKQNGRLDEGAGVAGFAERQRLVQKPLYDALEKKYAD